MSEDSDNLDSDTGMAAITKRAAELMECYPDQKKMFEGYIRSQRNEYDDLEDNLINVTWILRKQ